MTRPPHALTLLALAALLAVAACTPGTGDLGGVATAPPTSEPSLDAASPEATPAVEPGASTAPASPAAAMTTVRAYFFLASSDGHGYGVVPVLRQVPKTSAVATAAMQELLAGAGDVLPGSRTAPWTSISADTRLLGLTIDKGTATVNLSREFETNTDMDFDLRIAQVVWTLTQFPTVTGVAFLIDGAPSAAIDQTYTRMTTQQVAAIAVDRPAWRGVLGNPGRVSGYADVFEATFRVAVLDGAGHTLADVQAMATCGSGCEGTFDVTVPYTIGSAQWGTLRVYDRSAKDGSAQDVRDYPVWLTP